MAEDMWAALGYSSDEDKREAHKARNRIHAKETRRRKKDMVANLEASHDQLERDNAALAQRIQALEAETKKREMRLSCVDRALALRFSPEAAAVDTEAWAQLVTDDFELRLPHTPYRSTTASLDEGHSKLVKGVKNVVADVKSLRVCLDTLRRNKIIQAERRDTTAPVFSHTSSVDKASLAWTNDDALMAPYAFVVLADDKQILVVNGMLRASFKDTKLHHLDLSFDSAGVWNQLQNAAPSPKHRAVFKPVPKTLNDALAESDEARVITAVQRPFVIEHVNGAWIKLCGYEPDECKGKTLEILQGPETSKDTINAIGANAALGHAHSAFLTNYSKCGSKFSNFLRIFPLVDDKNGNADITHMLGVLQDVAAAA